MSIPRLNNAAIKCSIVDIVAPYSLEIVVHKLALDTLNTFGIITFLSVKSVLLNCIQYLDLMVIFLKKHFFHYEDQCLLFRQTYLRFLAKHKFLPNNYSQLKTTNITNYRPLLIQSNRLKNFSKKPLLDLVFVKYPTWELDSTFTRLNADKKVSLQFSSTRLMFLLNAILELNLLSNIFDPFPKKLIVNLKDCI